MKNLFFIFSFTALLFGSSFSKINAQCSVEIHTIQNECGQVVLFASAVNPLNNVCYSWNGGMNSGPVFTVYASGVVSVYVTCSNGQASEASEWINVNPCNPCTGEIKTTEYCGYTTLEVVGATACLWNTGANTNSINVTSPGNYSATVTCNGNSFVLNKIISSIKKVNASVSGNSEVCTGEKTNLTANGGMYYMWSTGSNSATVNVGKGTYHVTVTGANGCTAVVSAQVSELPAPAAPTITPVVNPQTGVITLISSVSSGNMWSNGATSQSINPTTSGVYTVSVKNSAGCMSLPSCGSNVVVSIKTITNTIVVHDTIYLNGGGNNTNGGLSFNSSTEWNKVTFVANVPNPNNFISYFWDFGDGKTGGGATTMNQYAQPGTYLVKLRAYYSNGSFVEVSNYVNITVFGKPCNRTGLSIKGQTDGAVFPQSQINSQTKVNVTFALPTGAWDWVWSTGNAGPDAKKGTVVQNSGAEVGTHEMFFNYMVQSENFCHVIKYTVVPGSGISNTDETENRSSSLDKEEIKVFPNPTSGTVELDLSGQPAGTYLINVMDQSGRHVTKKVIKQ